MTSISHPLDETARKSVGDTLQQALADLINLSLLAKQAHWNVVGRNFRSVHLQLDEVTDLARQSADAVAERVVTLGLNPDGRAGAIAAQSTLPPFPDGFVDDGLTVERLGDILSALVVSLREAVQSTGERDLVSQDLLLGIAAEIEKQYWMFQAQR
jgi:starvation-inducible DNA-binding protein